MLTYKNDCVSSVSVADYSNADLRGNKKTNPQPDVAASMHDHFYL